jgi:ribonuclease HII
VSDRPSLDELRRRYLDEGRRLTRRAEERLRADGRAGARAILDGVVRKRDAVRAEGRRLRTLSKFERALWKSGVTLVAGVDEAGMSPLAGPVVAGAVILPVGYTLPGVDDSKKLSAEERGRLVVAIKRDAVAWAVGRVEHDEIDRINIYRAGLLALRRAVEGLAVRPEHLLIDARWLRDVPIPQQGIVHGDALSISIAAASIVAKTTRDALMCDLDARFPGYGFARHKGYPVAEHVRALDTLGVCEVHRRSFTPVREAMGLVPSQRELFEPRSPTPRPDPARRTHVRAR